MLSAGLLLPRFIIAFESWGEDADARPDDLVIVGVQQSGSKRIGSEVDTQDKIAG